MLHEAIQSVVQEALSNIHTVTLAVVEKVNANTIDVLPVVSRVVDGKVINLPLFVDVPPIFLQGGSSYTAYPLKKGDHCLLLVSERCFDDWYHGGDFKPPLEHRMHDYSDSFALVGINPLASAITIPAVTTHFGDKHIEGNLTVTGDITATGNIIAGVGSSNPVSMLDHQHRISNGVYVDKGVDL